MVGKTISHYEITEQLGEGGMGVVYLARDTHLNRSVALKVLPPEKVADPEPKRRFIQEAQAASALNHPNIVHIYDTGHQDGVDYIAMEYVQGKTLGELIGRKGLKIGDSLKYGVQIADALSRAHAAGIIHRDLKPGNIMVDEHGLVKVLDFGVAKLAEPAAAAEDSSTRTMRPATEEGKIVGTAAYMSPEQAEGSKVDARSDIFSFGSVLYEMVTGRRAFQGDTGASTLAAVLKDEPRPASQITPDLPKEVERVIRRCLRKDPRHRFQHMDDLKVALEELKEECDSGTLSAVPQMAGTRRVRRVRLAILLILPLLVVAGWLVWRRGGGEEESPVVTQLTTYAGSELFPCFSPDGSQVAFTWGGEKGDNRDIYVKIVGEANSLRLTTNPGVDVYPAWSPDGKRIAFTRSAPGDSSGVYLISPLGGAERKLTNFAPVGRMSWSPDGRYLAVARGTSRASALVLLPVGGGEPRPISSPKPPAWDWYPAFSPDGSQLAYAGCSGLNTCDLYIQECAPDYTPRGSPRRITQQELLISGLDWSRDGESLVYEASVTAGLVTYLWRVDAKGRRPPARIELAGPRASDPTVAPVGNRMAFSREQGNVDIWRYTVGGVANPLLTSSLFEQSPRFSPDGMKVAFTSDRGGETLEIWVANADGSNPYPVTNRVGRYQGSPDWSPDGRWIAFDSQTKEGHWDIWVVEASGAGLRRVTSERSDDVIPSWSRDGKSIYFCSNRTGRDQIWRVAADGGKAEQITPDGGHTAFESFDGKTLYYTKTERAPVFAIPLAEKRERQIIDLVFARNFAVVEDGIYYLGRRSENRRYPLSFYQFSGGTTREIAQLEGDVGLGLTVSRDRKTFLFTKSSVAAGHDLMLVEWR